MKTWKNKLLALCLILGGVLGIIIDNDATFLVFALMIAIPLFLTKESVIAEDHADYIIDEDGNLHEVKKKTKNKK